MTTPTRQTACIRHGLLAGGAAHCPVCGRQSYKLDDDGDRATLRAFHKAALAARFRTFAIAGAAAMVAVDSLTSGGVRFDGATVAVGAVIGLFVGGAARSPAQHRLDRALKA